MTNGACNMNCSYCISGYSVIKRQHSSSNINDEKMLEVIGSATFDSISIWGGEPFYNFPKLRKTVEFCKRYYPEMPIVITSNGTAFSPSKIKFIKEYNLNIVLSHDADCQHYRGLDYLTDLCQLKMIKDIEKITFSTVIHNYNCDIPSIFEYFEKVSESLKKDVGWGFELFQLSSPETIKFLPQGKSLIKFSDSIDFLLDKFLSGHRFAISPLYKILMGMSNVIENNKSSRVRCGAYNRLTVTTNGVKAFCQVEAELGRYTYPTGQLPEGCSTCNVAKFCTGICPNINDAYRKKMCIVYKIFYTKLYNFLINLKFNQPTL